MSFAGLDLARRLEAAEALNGVECAEAQRLLDPTAGATVRQVASGSAIFVGAQSPLTHAVGLGMQGAVRPEELDRLEAFYRARGATVTVDLCPLADASLLELLGSRGYRTTEFMNMLIRPFPGSPIAPPEVPIRLANDGEEDLWACTVGRGFLEKEPLTAEEMDVGRNIFHMPSSLCYVAFAGNQPVAAGAMAAFRGIGLQSALIRERLRAAFASGSDLAAASTLPGSVSQRNYERNGFQVAYTKAILVR
jgi:hypothetical protein